MPCKNEMQPCRRNAALRMKCSIANEMKCNIVDEMKCSLAALRIKCSLTALWMKCNLADKMKCSLTTLRMKCLAALQMKWSASLRPCGWNAALQIRKCSFGNVKCMRKGKCLVIEKVCERVNALQYKKYAKVKWWW